MTDTTTRIVTKYAHEDLRGPRITAKADGRQRTVPYDHGAGYDGSHRKAAETLAAVLGLTEVKALVPGATNRHRRVWTAS